MLCPMFSLFQSTPPRGGRLAHPCVTITSQSFQSTPPRGGRQTWFKERQSSDCFNPRPRAGGDSRCLFTSVSFSVSIHAPARGATPDPGTSSSTFLFQSTPPRGGRQYLSSGRNAARSFQSTPPRGGRRVWP